MLRQFLKFSLCSHIIIYNLGCGILQQCDPEQDEGYCDGNVAMECGRINDTERLEWKRIDCSSSHWANQPYCVVGPSRWDPELAAQASCSGQSTSEPLCYEENIPSCKEGQKLKCGNFGSSRLEYSEMCTRL